MALSATQAKQVWIGASRINMAAAHVALTTKNQAAITGPAAMTN